MCSGVCCLTQYVLYIKLNLFFPHWSSWGLWQKSTLETVRCASFVTFPILVAVIKDSSLYINLDNVAINHRALLVPTEALQNVVPVSSPFEWIYHSPAGILTDSETSWGNINCQAMVFGRTDSYILAVFVIIGILFFFIVTESVVFIILFWLVIIHSYCFVVHKFIGNIFILVNHKVKVYRGVYVSECRYLYYKVLYKIIIVSHFRNIPSRSEISV